MIETTQNASSGEVTEGRQALLQGPVHRRVDEKVHPLKPGPALCLSGGGFRAMLFHAGVLWRLNDIGWLPKLQQISSVSGGSITAGVLAKAWDDLKFQDSIATNFRKLVIDPICGLASHTIDVPAVLKGTLWFGSISDYVARYYRRYLFGGTTLQDITVKDPANSPFFVFNATSVQSGVLWRFTKPYMWDYRVGKVEHPKIDLAVAVAASSAFPPVLSPATLRLSASDFVPDSGYDMQEDKYRKRIVLTDGGVYDNLGLETVWKNYLTVLVSDAGGCYNPEAKPSYNWPLHTLRVLNTIDNQVRDMRKRQVVDSLVAQLRHGSYWSIRADLQKQYSVKAALDCPFEKTVKLANISTRLAKLAPDIQRKVINWGYALTDCAIRKFVDPNAVPPTAFPFPDAGV
jgi:NTE family protein